MQVQSLETYRTLVTRSYQGSWEDPSEEEYVSWENFKPEFNVAGMAFSEFGVYISDDAYAEARDALRILRTKIDLSDVEQVDAYNTLAEKLEVQDV